MKVGDQVFWAFIVFAFLCVGGDPLYKVGAHISHLGMDRFSSKPYQIPSPLTTLKSPFCKILLSMGHDQPHVIGSFFHTFLRIFSNHR